MLMMLIMTLIKVLLWILLILLFFILLILVAPIGYHATGRAGSDVRKVEGQLSLFWGLIRLKAFTDDFQHLQLTLTVAGISKRFPVTAARKGKSKDTSESSPKVSPKSSLKGSPRCTLPQLLAGTGSPSKHHQPGAVGRHPAFSQENLESPSTPGVSHQSGVWAFRPLRNSGDQQFSYGPFRCLASPGPSAAARLS